VGEGGGGIEKSQAEGEREGGMVVHAGSGGIQLNQDEKSDGSDCVKRGKCGLLPAERGRRRAAGKGERVFLEARESKK